MRGGSVDTASPRWADSRARSILDRPRCSLSGGSTRASAIIGAAVLFWAVDSQCPVVAVFSDAHVNSRCTCRHNRWRILRRRRWNKWFVRTNRFFQLRQDATSSLSNHAILRYPASKCRCGAPRVLKRFSRGPHGSKFPKFLTYDDAFETSDSESSSAAGLV